MNPTAEELAGNISSLFAMKTDKGKPKRWSFTLEAGRGETYSNNDATLYGHSTYDRNSVLSGRSQRVFVTSWKDWDTALAAIEAVKKLNKKFRVEVIGGTTHVPISQIVSHLPDDTDY